MNSPFLFSLGVAVADQARAPQPTSIPPALNPSNIDLWSEAVNGVQVKDVAQHWARALNRYLNLCTQNDRFPFQQLHTSPNDQIVDILKDVRRTFVKYVDRHQLYQKMKIRTVDRQVRMTETGFVISVVAHGRIEDPTFPQMLLGLKPTGDQFPFVQPRPRYEKQLNQWLKMWATNPAYDNPERWELGFEVSVPMFPDVPGNGIPTKDQLQYFIHHILWLPVMKATRPRGIMHRLV